MRKCTVCHQEKATSEFYYQSRAKNQIHSQCKDCYRDYRKTYSAEHYQKYGDAYRARATIRRLKIKRALQIHLMEYMVDKSCIVCGEHDIRVLEFDHLDPKLKSFSIARAVTDGLKWDIILDEINKCQILCSNCHKKKTAIQYGWFKAIGMK